MNTQQLDRVLAEEQARRLGDLYEELERMLVQAKVSRATHAAHICRLIRVYGRDNVARMLRVLENDMKGTP